MFFLKRLLPLLAVLGASVAQAELTGVSLIGQGPATSLFATHAPGRPHELFVANQAGQIHILDLTTGQFNSQPFLDIGAITYPGAEEGLLGLAFDPDYENNGYFYVNYTGDTAGGGRGNRIDRFQVEDPLNDSTANAVRRFPLLDIQRSGPGFHNGGWIGFGPNDGYLYIASGDGGISELSDVYNSTTRFGKILRVDVRADDFPENDAENFAIPASNPFASSNDPNTLGEVWAVGLRNPWRASFDRVTGDLWIGDVGSATREEINWQPADSAGGENYGWPYREGDIATPSITPVGPLPTGLTEPVYDYLHRVPGESFREFEGNSVVGGYVYRGPDPDVQGQYFFADTISSKVWVFDPDDPDGTVRDIRVSRSFRHVPSPVSFGEDAAGNLYVVSYGGGVYRIDTDAFVVPEPASGAMIAGLCGLFWSWRTWRD